MKNNQQAVTNTQLEHPQMAVTREIRCQPISILSKAVTKMVRSHPTPFSTKLAETNTHGVDVDFAFMTDGLARLSMVQKMGYPNPEHPPKQDYVKRLLDIAFGCPQAIKGEKTARKSSELVQVLEPDSVRFTPGRGRDPKRYQALPPLAEVPSLLAAHAGGPSDQKA